MLSAEDGLLECLGHLIDTIENTGGINYQRNGTYGPAADEDWSDLADCYFEACDLTGRKPIISLADCGNCHRELSKEQWDCRHCYYDNRKEVKKRK